jgi:glycosyltransferase involved in cell wall biosynthesis
VSGRSLSYAVVTPARDDARNLEALGASMLAQTLAPDAWVIVDDGSTDGTGAIAARLAGQRGWIHVVSLEPRASQARGGPVVRAFVAGLGELRTRSDVIVKLDADLTFEPDYFARLVRAFENEERLGIASGVCHELVAGVWTPSFGTRAHVWGASRAYRRECLDDVLPLEERQGWDELDALKAQVRGWATKVVVDLPFRHHRRMGERDGRRGVWLAAGETAHYMDYRPSYLIARTVFRLAREPHALLMLWGYFISVLRREPRVADSAVRSHLRNLQRLRSLPLRVRELRGDVG